ncbi:MAG TPA: D-alanine--D-alanine ligase family protein [Cyclobacteriaceae bacterium]|nr:D-alanine--D-alanine ligase family protein [Cyclobacteriaceae bacterium]
MTKKKVAILFGGRSVEHGVSINSARNIFEYIDKDRFEPVPFGISTQGAWFLNTSVSKEIEKGEPLSLSLDGTKPTWKAGGKSLQIDVAFPVLHGTDGEDGSIQGLLKSMSVPMVGTGVLGSSVSMNKLTAKRLLQKANIPVAPFLDFSYAEKDSLSFDEISKQIGLPFMVKATSLGSSVGITKVKSKEDFQPAVEEAFRYDNHILIEKYIKGREIECAVLGNDPPQSSLPGEIVISDRYEFYTFDAKYVDNTAVNIVVPAKIDASKQEEIRRLSVKAFEALHCEDFARVDLFLAGDGNIYINEINTIPGFTNSSMYPMMWKERGVSFTELITKLIDIAFQRVEKARRVETDFKSSLKF